MYEPDYKRGDYIVGLFISVERFWGVQHRLTYNLIVCLLLLSPAANNITRDDRNEILGCGSRG